MDQPATALSSWRPRNACRSLWRVISVSTILGAYGSPESSLKTSGSDVIRLVRQAREAGINDEVPAFAATLFKRAIDADFGPEEHAALIKVLGR